jgi:hypothetical protein
MFLWDNARLFSWLRGASYALIISASLQLFMGSTRMALLLILTITMMYLLPCLVGEHGFAYLVRFCVYITYFLVMELRGVACFEWDRLFFGGAYVFSSLV